jgi:hypothetical protein
MTLQDDSYFATGRAIPVKYNAAAQLQMLACAGAVIAMFAAWRGALSLPMGCLGLLEHTLFFGGAVRRGYLNSGQLCTMENIAAAMFLMRIGHAVLNYRNLFSVTVTRIRARGKDPKAVLSKGVPVVGAFLVASAVAISTIPFELWADTERFSAGLAKAFVLATAQVCGISFVVPEVMLWVAIRRDLR